MPLTPGTRVGPYEILSAIGSGGMGEVYRARDTKLGRDVAIKVLLPSVASDPDRLARFSREAQVLASLNHPNIAHIHGLEDAGPSAGSGQAAVRALVMELVEGEDLAERLALGPIPIDEVLPIARQIAEALEAAHDAGIVHRDLKPANIKVRPDGTVKVLDFGLAKATAPVSSSSLNAMSSPTLSIHATQAGIILGTVAYMSPEQARGKAVDKRSDIWALGCVLFEMLTGVRAFPGDDVTDTIVSVVSKDPDWNALPPAVPAGIRRLLRRCLEKDPKRRLDSAAAVRLEIDEALIATPVDAHPATLPNPASRTTAVNRWTQLLPWGAEHTRRRLGMPVVAATCMLIGLIAGALTAGVVVRNSARTADGSRRVARFAIFPDDLPAGSLFSEIAMTPDGGQIIYVVERPGTQQLHVRAVDQIAGRAIGGTDGATEMIALSPRGDQIAFFAGGEMKVIPVSGGASTTVTPVRGNLAGASWAGNDTIVFAQAGAQRPGLLRVAASGGTPALVASPDPQKNEREYRYPYVLPDGESVVFTILPLKGGIAAARIAVRSLRTGDQKDLLEGGTDAVYLPTGYLVLGRNGGLAALPFDLAALEVRGRPLPVVENVVITGAGNAAFSVSADGTLVYLPGTSDPPRRLIRVTRDGTQIEPIVSEALAGARYPRLSLTDGRLAVTIGASFAGDVWVHDLDRGRQPNKLTFDGHDTMPIWSPEGKTIVFQSDRSGPRSLFSIPADGSVVQPQPLLPSDKTPWPWHWSPDGRALIFSELHPETRSDLWMLPMTGDRKPRPWLNTSFQETDARFSPDGRLIAYATDQSGGQEVWVRYVDASAPIRVSSGGGHEPVWARDGRELFYQSGARLMAVPVLQTSPDVRFGPARVVLDGGFFASSWLTPRTYDVGPDGRLLMIQPLGEAPRPSFVLVQNWTEELKRLVPVN